MGSKAYVRPESGTYRMSAEDLPSETVSVSKKKSRRRRKPKP
jgi:hypothetical protein